MNINGMINIYKEKGYTSFDVVAILRRILKTKKIGHTGTLDPEAEGVLLVCVGKATKLVEYVTNQNKTYQCTMRLGVVTDTYDTTGTVINTCQTIKTEEQVKAAITSFCKTYPQEPPMYSAIKINGKKLYQLARQGKVVERKKRLVTIERIDQIRRLDPFHYQFEVTCSKGTYIRSLIHDIGQQLGVGAAMSQLIRTKVNQFDSKQALRLEEVEKLAKQGELERCIISIDQLLEAYPRLDLPKQYRKLLDNGALLPINSQLEEILRKQSLQSEEPSVDQSSWDESEPLRLYRVYSDQEELIGLYKIDVRSATMPADSVEQCLKVYKYLKA